MGRIIDGVIEWTAKALGYLAILLMLIILWEVVLRYVFNAPTFWAHETSDYIFGVYLALGGAYASVHREQIRVDVLYLRLNQRKRAIFDLFGPVFAFVFAGALLWAAAPNAWEAWCLRERSITAWAPPIYPMRFVIPIAAFLLLCSELAWFIRSLTTAIMRRRPGE